MATKRSTVSLKEQDQHAVRVIQTRFHLLSQTDTIRFALRVLAWPPERAGALRELSLPGFPSPARSLPSHEGCGQPALEVLRIESQMLAASLALQRPIEQRVQETRRARAEKRQEYQRLRMLAAQLQMESQRLLSQARTELTCWRERRCP